MSASHPGEPFEASADGCGAAVSRASPPRRCYQPVVYAGLTYFPYPMPTAWLSFTCEEHRAHLIAPRRLTDRDRAQLEDRRARVRRATKERKRWDPPQPLATGHAARQLAARARAWVENRETGVP